MKSITAPETIKSKNYFYAFPDNTQHPKSPYIETIFVKIRDICKVFFFFFLSFLLK